MVAGRKHSMPSSISRSLLISSLLALVAGDEAPLPFTMTWSSKTYGPDGPSHAVTVGIGTPVQQIDLYPGSTWSSHILGIFKLRQFVDIAGLLREGVGPLQRGPVLYGSYGYIICALRYIWKFWLGQPRDGCCPRICDHRAVGRPRRYWRCYRHSGCQHCLDEPELPRLSGWIGLPGRGRHSVPWGRRI